LTRKRGPSAGEIQDGTTVDVGFDQNRGELAFNVGELAAAVSS